MTLPDSNGNYYEPKLGSQGQDVPADPRGGFRSDTTDFDIDATLFTPKPKF